MPARLTTKEFIKRAKKIHGHVYEYKIGVTNNTLEERYNKKICSDRIVTLEEFKDFRTVNESWPETLGGKTEFFKWDILNKHKE